MSNNLHFGSRGTIEHGLALQLNYYILLVIGKIISWIFQGLLRVQGRPAVSYDDQGMVFAVAYGSHIRMFDARKFEKVVVIECVVWLLVFNPSNLLRQ